MMAPVARRYLALATVLAAAPSVLAHGHHAELTEEEMNAPVDAILWIHMFLQCAVWGVLFPIGMVLGITRSRWHVPLQVRCEGSSRDRRYTDRHSHRSECWICPYDRRLFVRPLTQGPNVPCFRAWIFRKVPLFSDSRSTCSWGLLEDAHSRKDYSTVGSSSSRCPRKGISGARMDSNAVWRHHVPWLLQRRPSRPVSGTLHHGGFVSFAQTTLFLTDVD